MKVHCSKFMLGGMILVLMVMFVLFSAMCKEVERKVVLVESQFSITTTKDNETSKATSKKVMIVKSQTDVSTKKEIGRSEATSWVILAFSDKRYLPVAKLWYQHLKKLGYENHILIALDKPTYLDLKENPTYRCELGLEIIGKNLNKIFKTRMEITLKYLKTGKNVFISDVDTFWNWYLNLDLLLETKYDAYHTIARFPPSVFKEWGFTVCGCISGIHSNQKTIQFYQIVLDKCGSTCDDQKMINEVYAFTYNMKWHDSEGFSESYDYRIKTFNESFVARYDINCQSWIAMGLADKTVEAKMQQWEEYNKKCQKTV